MASSSGRWGWRGRAARRGTNRLAYPPLRGAPEHIDELGHAKQPCGCSGVQDMATAHWDAVARPKRGGVLLVVGGHEIDYGAP